MTLQAHPAAEELVDYFRRMLEPARELDIERHLAECDECAPLARRIHELTFALARTNVDTLKRAYAEARRVAGTVAPGTLAAEIREVLYTTRGWIAAGAAAMGLPVRGTRVGDWSIDDAFALQGVALSAAAQPLALSYDVPGAGRLTLQILPSPEGDWRVVARLSEAVPGATVVIGLGDEKRPRLGTRTVAADREQQFIVARDDVSDLHVTLEWTAPDGGERRQVLPLPVRGER